MRGKGYEVKIFIARVRITPAHAGKRDTDEIEKNIIKDHPRTCGEKRKLLLHIVFHLGSPPHMRGKVSSLKFLKYPIGITPAHAGKRLMEMFSSNFK